MTWENDERGKPCRWQKQIVVTAEDWAESRQRVLSADKTKEIDDAVEACRAALKELEASAERYVIIVEPELVWCRDLEQEQEIHTVRTRVRWVPDDETAGKHRNFRQQVFNAVDDEYARAMFARTAHKTAP